MTDRNDSLSFSNLKVLVEGYIFDQWLKEDEEWPWKSPKGKLPRNMREKTAEKKRTRKARVKTNEARGKKQTDGRKKLTRQQRKCINAKKAVIQSPAIEAHKPCPPARKQNATRAKLSSVKKNIKKLSEKKYQLLKQRVKMNITVSLKEREHYLEQKTLRKLHAYLG